MMEFKLSPHGIYPDRQKVEIWSSGELIGAIYAGDTERGIKFITKYPFSVINTPGFPNQSQLTLIGLQTMPMIVVIPK